MAETIQEHSSTDELLKILIGVMGRTAIPEAKLRAIVSPQGSQKYVTAYNLCDGQRTLSDVARGAGIDVSNLAKAVGRWSAAGVVFRIGKEQSLLGLYRLQDDLAGSGIDDVSFSVRNPRLSKGRGKRLGENSLDTLKEDSEEEL